MTEIIFCDAKALCVSFFNPDNIYDKHRYTEVSYTDNGPDDDNAGIEYDKIIIDIKRPHFRITRYPKDPDSLETYKYLPCERYIVNVIRKDKCTDCEKHSKEKKTDKAVAAFTVKES